MIVRNEAHVVREALDSAAPYVTSWVIVDTGSEDGTQDVVATHMAGLGLPGELHERSWRDFGHNRSEALMLAHGHGDYIWVIDADDLLHGTPAFAHLGADVYQLRYGPDPLYWRRQLFRDGVPWRYEGVLHEYAACEDAFVEDRLQGEYHVESRRLGARNRDPQKYARDAELLLAEVRARPGDARSVFYLAQSYFDSGDFAHARDWYAQRVEMDGWDEETYLAVFRMAAAMSEVGHPWPEVQHAYLQAWEFRPTRAEPLHAIAHQYRLDQRYRLGYLFAERAANIPLPEEDSLFIGADVYGWRAADEQAVCASWLGQYAEAFALCRRILARSDIPDGDRRRITGNRDVCVPAMIDAASSYPSVLAQRLVAGLGQSEVTVSLIAGADRQTVEQTLNSLLQCCLDVDHVGRFLVLALGMTAEDRVTLLERYRFLEFIDVESAHVPGSHLARIRRRIDTRFWLHVDGDWRFFAPEKLVTRLIAVLKSQAEVVQVCVNLADAAELTGSCAAQEAIHWTAEAGRYLLSDVLANGPAMFDTSRLDRIGGFNATTDGLFDLGRRAADAGLRAATLDEVLCITAQ